MNGSIDLRTKVDFSNVKKKINLQAIARGCEPLMSCILPDDGWVFCGSDLESGEPTITAQYTQDPLVKYFAFEGEGKEPRYSDDGQTFMCNDPYLALAAVTPLGRPLVEKAMKEGIDGVPFGKFWISTQEPGKNCFLKKTRKIHKPFYLGLDYGLGWRTLRANAAKEGVKLTEAEARGIHEAFWDMTPRKKAFKTLCEDKVASQGYINNPFGFRGRPTPRNAFNFMIQSSVNPVVDILCQFWEAECEHDKRFTQPPRFFTLVHDEVIYQVRIEDVKCFKECLDKALDRLRALLKWNVPVRAGFAVARNLYLAKDGESREALDDLGVDTSYLD